MINGLAELTRSFLVTSPAKVLATPVHPYTKVASVPITHMEFPQPKAAELGLAWLQDIYKLSPRPGTFREANCLVKA